MVLLIALVAGLYLVQASQMSAVGRQLEAMHEQYDQLKRENAELLYLISQEAGIVRLQQRSAEKGLIPAEAIEYLLVSVDETVLPLPGSGPSEGETR
jgi:hypothetical protein